MLFYLKLLSDLEVLGFRLNPYNPCVNNMVINGKYITINSYVDDLNIFNADYFGVMKVIQLLKG